MTTATTVLTAAGWVAGAGGGLFWSHPAGHKLTLHGPGTGAGWFLLLAGKALKGKGEGALLAALGKG
jgi:hypothetical protein